MVDSSLVTGKLQSSGSATIRFCLRAVVSSLVTGEFWSSGSVQPGNLVKR